MSILTTSMMIKGLDVSNRLVMPPMATAKSDANGTVTQALCDYYDEKSKGGYIGLIITEHSYISPEGKASNGQLSISHDEDIKGLRLLPETIHKNDTKVFAQINHAGGATTPEITGCQVLSPSAVLLPGRPVVDNLKAMDIDDIKKVVSDFANAALRAKKAGYDGVEIHSAHGYLLNQFYSPLTNKRTDDYNGTTLMGRIKLHLEVIAAVRSVVGDDYPIALRLGACDYREGGSTIADSVLAAKAFEQAGIDLLDISGGFCGYINPNVKEQGYFSEITEEIKKNVTIPVLLTGGITDGKTAESLLQSEKADMIGVGRSILKNSDWSREAILALK